MFWEPDSAERILVGIGSCRAKVVEVATEETETEVRVRVWVEGGSDEDCADGVAVNLDQPLGERRVIDGASGETVPQGP